jgi:hypothetical protein
MSLTTFLIIAQIQTCISLVGFILTLRIKDPSQVARYVGALLIVSVTGQLVPFALRELQIANPNYATSVHSMFEFALLSVIYYYAIGKPKYKMAFATTAVGFVAFELINVLFIQKDAINTNALILSSILVIGYTLFYFSWLLRELPTTRLDRFPMFWINSAWIIYSSGNLFLFAFTSYLVNVLNNNLIYYWSMFNILAIIKSGMIVYGIWLDLQNTKSRS